MVHMRLTLFGLALIVAPLVYAQRSQNLSQLDADFRINPAKPFVYIEFSKVGPRKPIRHGEPGTGVWLRLVNKCRLPIELTKLGSDENPEVLHEVVYDDPDSVVVTPDGKQNPRPSSEMPFGYRSHVGQSYVILPAHGLGFNVPVNHVAAEWHIEVPFHFKFPGDPCCQPRMYALFTLSEVPEGERLEFVHSLP
jgi:hypothetical protein